MKTRINPLYSELRPFIEDLEAHFQRSSDILYDKRNQIKLVPYEGARFVVKAFRVPNRLNRFVYRYLRTSKASRSFDYSMKLGETFCPAPVAIIEQHKNFLLGKSYYVSRFYDYDFTIRPILLDEDYNHDTRIKVLEAFSDFTYELHEAGIFHRDYSYGNILIKAVGDRYEFNIIDVNRMEFKPMNINDRMRNFARLSAKDAYMDIIIGRYAQSVDVPIEVLLPLAKSYRDKFMKNRRLKNKLRGR